MPQSLCRSGAQILTSTYGPGGQVWLFAKNVTQEAGSTITAPQGQVVLAAGTELQVATNGLGQMSFAVATDGTNTVDSLGAIAADRGAVGMFADFINHRGSVNVGNQGSVAMDAARELRIQGTSQINAPDGSITLRGGSVLEVEYDSIINADGANGRISFESNNLLVSPSGNTHAVGGQVIFNQYQPTQYTPGAEQQLWVTPAGYEDRDTLVYRRSDGNNVVRFNRYGSNAVPPYVEPFEVVLDSRTGAVISGPTTVAALSSAAAARSAAQQAYATADAARTAAFRSGTFTQAIQTAFNTAEAALAVADPVYKTAYWAASPPVFNSDQFFVGNQNTGAGVLPSTAVPTSDGGSLAHNGSTPGLNLLSSAGTLVRAGLAGQTYNVPVSDGTYITRTATGLDVFALNGSALPSVIEPVALGGFNVTRVLVPNQVGGLSVIRLMFASHSAWDLTKTVAAYTPSNNVSGAAGNAAAFATTPGAVPAPTVVSGRAGGGAILDDSSSICNSALCTGSAGDAQRLADAQAIIAANRPRPNDVGNMTLRDFLDSLIAADKAGQGSTIDDQSAIIAVQALFRAAGRGGTVSNDGAAMLQDNIQDNGELRQLILGWGDLGSMTPEGRVHVLEQWLQVQNVNQRQGGSLNADQISVVDVVSHMTTHDEMSIFMDTVVNAARGWLP